MKTILFADDQRNIREFCRDFFAKEGYRVLLARDGIEALEMFIAKNPDLAVLDISMPRSSGLEALDRIKGVSPRTPVILFTAHAGDYKSDCRTLRAVACVEKSQNLAELKAIVAHAFNIPTCEPTSERIPECWC
jgi:CheY-like chemotaxis protein